MSEANQDDANLAAQIIAAMKDYEAADATRKEKAVAAGKLLAEAQKRHPTDSAFEKFLKLAGGVGIRRAKDLIGIALGQRDFERHQRENAAAQQRHRDKLKAERIEREKAAAARPKPEPKPKGKGKPSDALRNASNDKSPADRSATSFREFQYACVTYLPRLNEDDLKKALAYVNGGAWRREAA